MKTTADLLLVLVAFLHLWFMVLESFLWTKPLGLKTFRMSLEQAQTTRVLALNQGLYNGFLSAGLIFALVAGIPAMMNFLLVCVIVAGIVGGWSVGKKIFIVQSLPAVAALILRCVS